MNNEARLRADSSDVSLAPADSVPCDIQPVVVSTANPEYPEDALASRIQGAVYVRMWIDTTGKVKRVRLVKSDDPIFNVSAIATAFQWRFKPATLAGRPVNFWVTMPFRFAVAQ